jgi:hypothetical protein
MTGRRRWLVLAAAVLAAACASPQPDVVRTGSQVYAPTTDVEMLEQPPSRPYTEIGVIDAPGEPGALRAQVLVQVRDKARQLGADAVILTDLSHRAPTTQRLNPTTGYYETVGGQTIPAFKGIAIKYR